MSKTLTMFDAVTVTNIPAAAELIMGYVDGRDTAGNYAAVRKRFPHARIVRCTVTGHTLDAEVGDVERFDMTPADGAAWAKRKIAALTHPTLYCNLSTWPAVRAAVAAADVGGPVSYLVASYDNKARIPRGAIGKQFSTGAFDTSVVNANWPGVLPAPLSRAARLAAQTLFVHLSARRTPPIDRDAILLLRVAQQANRVGMIDAEKTGPGA